MKSTQASETLTQRGKALIEKPVATKENSKAIEAADPILINEILARRAQLTEEMKLAKAEKDELEDIIRDLIGKKDELTVHGAKVASIARWRETSVNTDYVKEYFSLADYPELYKRADRSRLTIH